MKEFSPILTTDSCAFRARVCLFFWCINIYNLSCSRVIKPWKFIPPPWYKREGGRAFTDMLISSSYGQTISGMLNVLLTLGRARKFIPPPWYKGGGMEPLLSFWCCSILKPFYLQWKAFDLLNKMRYMIRVVALLEACDVTNNGCHLGFYQELEIRWKLQEMVIFVLNIKTNTKISSLHDFSKNFWLYCWKKLKNMYLLLKMAWPPITYDVISHNHRNWPSLNLTQNARVRWTNSYWEHQVLMFYPLGKKLRKTRTTQFELVKDWIMLINSVNGYRLLSYVCPHRKYSPYGKTFYQILWGINEKATHNCSSGPVKKKNKKKRKENMMGLREHKIPWVGLIFLLGLPLKTEILTLEIVTCKLLLLKRPTISVSFNQVCLRDMFC